MDAERLLQVEVSLAGYAKHSRAGMPKERAPTRLATARTLGKGSPHRNQTVIIRSYLKVIQDLSFWIGFDDNLDT